MSDPSHEVNCLEYTESSGSHETCNMEHERELSRGYQKWFSEVATQQEQAFVNEFRSVSNRYDLFEICAPWDSPLSDAVIRLGVRLFGWVVTMVMIWLLDRGVLVP